MTVFCVSAQDISSFSFALWKDGFLVREMTTPSSPEGYLEILDRMLKEWKIPLSSLGGIVVVSGPGSFTASRVSVVIANTIAFTCQIPILGIENPQRLVISEMAKTLDFAVWPPIGEFVVPMYDRAPHITFRR